MVFRNGYSVLDCIVLDLSEGGARLKLTNWNVLPNRFELRMENSPPQIATVCHRAADVTGIRFLLDGASNAALATAGQRDGQAQSRYRRSAASVRGGSQVASQGWAKIVRTPPTAIATP